MSRARERADGSFGDLDITDVGSIQLDSISGDGDTNTSITFSGSDVITVATGGSTSFTANADQTISFSEDIKFPDDKKAKFGAAANLQIYADNINSYITESGSSGNLRIQGQTVRLEKADGEIMLRAVNDAQVELYYNNVIKVLTSSTGINLPVDGDSIKFGANSEVVLTHVHNAGLELSAAGNLDTLTLKSTDTDASAGPILKLSRDNNSASASDVVGKIIFTAEDGGNNLTDYAEFLTQITDASDGSESVRFIIKGMKAGNYRKLIDFNTTETVFNDESDDLDFRVESNGNTHALFVDSGNDHVNIGTATDLGATLNVSGTGHFETTGNETTLTLKSTDADAAVGPVLTLHRESSSPADDDIIGRINFIGEDSGGTDTTYGRIETVIMQESNGSEDATMEFRIMKGGTERNILELDRNAVIINEDSQDIDFRVESNGNTHMIFVDANSDHVNIGQAGDSEHTLNVNGNGFFTTADNTDTLTLESTDADANSGPVLCLHRNSGSPADADLIGRIDFSGESDLSSEQNYAVIKTFADDVSHGSESGQFSLFTRVAGSEIERMSCGAAATVFNDNSADLDFRVESNGKTHALFVDGGNDKVGIINSTPNSFESGYNDLVIGDTDTHHGLTIVAGTTSQSDIGFADGTSGDAKYRGFVVYQHQTDKLLLGTAGTTAMQVMSTNKVGINIANSGTAMLKLYIPDSQYGLETLPAVNQTYYAAIFRNSSGNDVGRIESTASATSFVTSSDYRLKENVSYDFDATTRLKQLKPSRFNFINTPDTTVDGFLAHEVSSIVPEAISGTKDEIETKEKVVVNSSGVVIAENIEEADWIIGKEDGTHPTNSTWEASKVVPIYQAIDQSKLVPLMVKTIQEAMTRIETLEQEVKELKG